MVKKQGVKPVAENRKARHDYFIEETYECGIYFNTDPLRPKRLLLHKNEIRKLAQQVQKQGYTLVPLSVYLKNGRMKLSLGVCVGKHLHDKRDAMAERTAKRDMERALRTH